MLAQFFSIVEIEYLPVCIPNGEEINNAHVYAGVTLIFCKKKKTLLL